MALVQDRLIGGTAVGLSLPLNWNVGRPQSWSLFFAST